MRIRLSTDLLTGLLFLALGAFAMIYGSRYSLGTAARMGPGYYPLLASSGLLLVVAARLADREFRPLEVAILAICLVTFTLAIFRYGLGMPLRLWPAGW